MTKQMTFIALLLLGVLGLSGCSDVRSCKRGERGCVGGAPLANGSCKAGLKAVSNVCVEEGAKCDDCRTGEICAENGYCVAACDCPSGQVCGEDGSCLSYCEPYAMPAVESELPPRCKDTDGTLFSFQETCKATCLQRCRRAEVFCPGYVCDPNTCDEPTVLAACRAECPGGEADCIAQTCERVRDNECNGFMCPVGHQRDCSDVQCRNTCITNGTDNTKDGFCDDGDPNSADYALCAFGNDCADCGPRKGTRPELTPIGGSCVRDTACGYRFDFETSPGWCVSVPGAPGGQFSCVPNCTGNEEEDGNCPSGYECRGLEFSDGEPFTDADNRQAFACMPVVCE